MTKNKSSLFPILLLLGQTLAFPASAAMVEIPGNDTSGHDAGAGLVPFRPTSSVEAKEKGNSRKLTHDLFAIRPSEDAQEALADALDQIEDETSRTQVAQLSAQFYKLRHASNPNDMTEIVHALAGIANPDARDFAVTTILGNYPAPLYLPSLPQLLRTYGRMHALPNEEPQNLYELTNGIGKKAYAVLIACALGEVHPHIRHQVATIAKKKLKDNDNEDVYRAIHNRISAFSGIESPDVFANVQALAMELSRGYHTLDDAMINAHGANYLPHDAITNALKGIQDQDDLHDIANLVEKHFPRAGDREKGALIQELKQIPDHETRAQLAQLAAPIEEAAKAVNALFDLPDHETRAYVAGLAQNIEYQSVQYEDHVTQFLISFLQSFKRVTSVNEARALIKSVQDALGGQQETVVDYDFYAVTHQLAQVPAEERPQVLEATDIAAAQKIYKVIIPFYSIQADLRQHVAQVVRDHSTQDDDRTKFLAAFKNATSVAEVDSLVSMAQSLYPDKSGHGNYFINAATELAQLPLDERRPAVNLIERLFSNQACPDSVLRALRHIPAAQREEVATLIAPFCQEDDSATFEFLRPFETMEPRIQVDVARLGASLIATPNAHIQNARATFWALGAIENPEARAHVGELTRTFLAEVPNADIGDVLYALKRFDDPASRTQFFELVRSLRNPYLELERNPSPLFRAFRNTLLEDVPSVAELARSFFTDDMTDASRFDVIWELGSIAQKDRQSFTDQMRGLIRVDMSGEDRATLVKYATGAGVSVALNVLANAHKLATPTMNGQAIIDIVYRLNRLQNDDYLITQCVDRFLANRPADKPLTIEEILEGLPNPDAE